MSLFETGPVVMTVGIKEIAMTGGTAADVIESCLDRHCKGDWGDLCDDDKQLNNDSLKAEKEGGYTDSLFSCYNTDYGKIFVITECDRSVTTVLLAEEY